MAITAVLAADGAGLPTPHYEPEPSVVVGWEDAIDLREVDEPAARSAHHQPFVSVADAVRAL